jgi:hypothetical protein
MEQFDKREFNNICAEFMGYKLITPKMPEYDSLIEDSYWASPEKILCTEDEIRYDSDWNWIMNVVDTIEIRCSTPILIVGNECIINPSNKNIYTTCRFNEGGTHKKEAVLQAIWKFLNWYMQQMSQNKY